MTTTLQHRIGIFGSFPQGELPPNVQIFQYQHPDESPHDTLTSLDTWLIRNMTDFVGEYRLTGLALPQGITAAHHYAAEYVTASQGLDLHILTSAGELALH